jgi:hypothetical protein
MNNARGGFILPTFRFNTIMETFLKPLFHVTALFVTHAGFKGNQAVAEFTTIQIK